MENIIGWQVNLTVGEDKKSTEEIDSIFRRIDAARKGIIPVTLQPGDTVVRRFVLRTRNWLFFTPLYHNFIIKISYSSDEQDHFATIAYQANLRATMAAVALGAIVGAVMGSTVKNLNALQGFGSTSAMFYTYLVSTIASVAVVIAFARKATAQSFVSIEDFWGGSLIGFSVRFFGFDAFLHLFQPNPPAPK